MLGRPGRALDDPDAPPLVPGQVRRPGQQLVCLADDAADTALPLVDPHVAQRIRVEESLGLLRVQPLVDGVGHAPVEGQHHVQVGSLLVGVVAEVVIEAAAHVRHLVTVTVPVP